MTGKIATPRDADGSGRGDADPTASTVEDLGTLASVLGALAAAPGGGPALVAGDLVGDRYRIESVLGRGGMGIVYRARDTRLGRDVAIKVCTARSSAALARLEREAQTLARLSHPNVVVVHEVGEVGDRVFIAMEYVAGGTARRWARTRPRSWREVIALYTAAGDGLAAAHAAGIVHRDVKPDNILVGEDGRPRIADFGLVDVDSDGIAGTPAYMAPEQRAGGAIDARVDQFALCGSIWEALFEAPPYANPPQPGAEPPSPPATAPSVSRHVVAALQRGLAVDPAQRWPELAPLLAELRRDPAARRRRIAITAAIAAVAVAAGGAIAFALAGGGATPCEDGTAALAGVWNADRSARIEQRFAAEQAGPSWGVLHDRIGAYATSWIAARRTACRATRVDGSQSPAMLDRRMVCIAAARARLDAGLTVLEQNTRAVLASANDLIGALPDLSRCADVVALAAQPMVPVDPGARDRLAAAQRTIEAARMSRFVMPDLELAGRAVTAAKESGWSPAVAEATLVLGELQRERMLHDADASLREATRLALASGSDEIAAWAMANLAWQDAEDGRLESARTWADLAHGLWSRLGEPAQLGVRVIGAEALTAIAGGAPADGLTATRRQIDLATQAFGTDALAQAANHKNLAHALMWTGQTREAATEIAQALDQARAVIGDDHPMLAGYWRVSSEIAGVDRRFADAIADMRRSVAITTRWYGDSADALIDVLPLFGGMLVQHGDIAEGRAAIEHALALAQRRGDGPSAKLAKAEINLAVSLFVTGDVDGADKLGTHGMAMLEAALGPQHPELAKPLVLAGYIARARRDYDGSARALERAVAITSTALGDGNAETTNARLELARTLVEAGRAADAVAALAPSIDQIAAGAEVPDPVAGEASLVLADAAWRTGDRTRARAAAMTSRDRYTAAGADYADARDHADHWLRAHGGAR